MEGFGEVNIIGILLIILVLLIGGVEAIGSECI
jgi:hypothetical protein